MVEPGATKINGEKGKVHFVHTTAGRSKLNKYIYRNIKHRKHGRFTTLVLLIFLNLLLFRIIKYLFSLALVGIVLGLINVSNFC